MSYALDHHTHHLQNFMMSQDIFIAQHSLLPFRDKPIGEGLFERVDKSQFVLIPQQIKPQCNH